MQDGSIYKNEKRPESDLSYIYSTIKAKLQEEARSFECISNRYGLPFCLMLIHMDDRSDISQLVKSNTRCADRFIKINESYYALLFFANRPDSHAKVENKILFLLEQNYPHAKISIGTACKESLDSDNIILKAVQNVLLAQKMGGNAIIDNF